MASAVSWNIRDASGEYSNFRVPVIDYTAGNFAANQGLVSALQNALLGIIIGNIASRTTVLDLTDVNDTPVANQFAQRELKALVSFRNDVTQALLRAEVPTPDLQFLIPESDMFDLTATEVAQFVTDFEAIVRAGGVSAVTIESIRLVGRNL